MDRAQSPKSNPADDPRIGLVLLGRYRILRRLGKGGMGTIYEATHDLIGRKVAIKCLHADLVTDKEFIERFKREARAATAVGNEHIVDVTDMGDLPDGSPFIVMEMLEGREFAEVVDKEAPLPIGRTIRIALQVCDALGAAHEKGIVHRDLKPENIFLLRRKNDTDFVKVLDFGISKMHEHANLLQNKLTQTGVTIGTPQYMSLEQAQGLATCDHRADIYSLGVILCEALTGALPFRAASFATLIVKLTTLTAASLRVRRPGIPEELDAAVRKMLARNPEDRFASMAAVAEALRPYRSLTSPGERPRRPTTPPLDIEAATVESQAPPAISGVRSPAAASTAASATLASAATIVLTPPSGDEPVLLDDRTTSELPPAEPRRAPAGTLRGPGTIRDDRQDAARPARPEAPPGSPVVGDVAAFEDEPTFPTVDAPLAVIAEVSARYALPTRRLTRPVVLAVLLAAVAAALGAWIWLSGNARDDAPITRGVATPSNAPAPALASPNVARAPVGATVPNTTPAPAVDAGTPIADTPPAPTKQGRRPAKTPVPVSVPTAPPSEQGSEPSPAKRAGLRTKME